MDFVSFVEYFVLKRSFNKFKRIFEFHIKFLLAWVKDCIENLKWNVKNSNKIVLNFPEEYLDVIFQFNAVTWNFKHSFDAEEHEDNENLD